MRISDWSSDVCSSDLLLRALDVSFEQCAIDCEKAIEQPQFRANFPGCGYFLVEAIQHIDRTGWKSQASGGGDQRFTRSRSEEHTSELQSLMRISYAVFCLKKTNKIKKLTRTNTVDKQKK